jgi:hypothetical protein
MDLETIRKRAQGVLLALPGDEPVYYPMRQAEATALLVLALCEALDGDAGVKVAGVVHTLDAGRV